MHNDLYEEFKNSESYILVNGESVPYTWLPVSYREVFFSDSGVICIVLNLLFIMIALVLSSRLIRNIYRV